MTDWDVFDDFSDHERDWDSLIDAYDSGLYDPQ